MTEKFNQECSHPEIIQIENSNVFRCDVCGHLFSGAEILDFYKKQLQLANEGIWAGDWKTRGHRSYKDKNGIDIYDGDILKLGFAEASGEAKFENGTFWVYHLGIKRHISDYEQSGIQVIKSNIIK